MFASFSRIAAAADVLFTAARVSGAVERHAQPTASDLRRLGIEPKVFASIHLE